VAIEIRIRDTCLIDKLIATNGLRHGRDDHVVHVPAFGVDVRDVASVEDELDLHVVSGKGRQVPRRRQPAVARLRQGALGAAQQTRPLGLARVVDVLHPDFDEVRVQPLADAQQVAETERRRGAVRHSDQRRTQNAAVLVVGQIRTAAPGSLETAVVPTESRPLKPAMRVIDQLVIMAARGAMPHSGHLVEGIVCRVVVGSRLEIRRRIHLQRQRGGVRMEGNVPRDAALGRVQADHIQELPAAGIEPP